jgi:homoserine kinase type II
MALLTSFDLPAAQRVGLHYGLTVASVEPLSLGSVNSNFRLLTAEGNVLFGRIYEEQDLEGAKAEARLLRGLTQAGVATSAPLLPLEADQISVHAGKPVALYPWVPGESLCHARLLPVHCERLGCALARVHLASASLAPLPQGRFGVPELRQRLSFIRERTHNFDSALTWIDERLSHYVAQRKPLPTGLTHGDLFRDNVLWQGDEISALLDFESACEGAFIYDLMVCVLAWCYTDSFQMPRVRALFAGYERERPLLPEERQLAVTEGAIACLRFATTRLTDFELRATPEKPAARDYQRFVQRLQALEAGVLAPVLQAPVQHGLGA